MHSMSVHYQYIDCFTLLIDHWWFVFTVYMGLKIVLLSKPHFCVQWLLEGILVEHNQNRNNLQMLSALTNIIIDQHGQTAPSPSRFIKSFACMTSIYDYTYVIHIHTHYIFLKYISVIVYNTDNCSFNCHC